MVVGELGAGAEDTTANLFFEDDRQDFAQAVGIAHGLRGRGVREEFTL